MPESAASSPDPITTIPRPASSPDGTAPMPFSSPGHAVPPMPSEIPNRHDGSQRPAAGGMWRTAMTALRTMMRRTPRN